MTYTQVYLFLTRKWATVVSIDVDHLLLFLLVLSVNRSLSLPFEF
jgi:hypothetical protein